MFSLPRLAAFHLFHELIGIGLVQRSDKLNEPGHRAILKIATALLARRLPSQPCIVLQNDTYFSCSNRLRTLWSRVSTALISLATSRAPEMLKWSSS